MDFFSSALDAFKVAAVSLVPAAVAAFSPAITAVVKSASEKTVGSLPNAVKPVVNAFIGAVIAAFLGVDPVTGVIGAQVGKSVRDATFK